MRFFSFALFILVSSLGFSQKNISMVYPNFPPFTFEDGENASGLGIEIAKKIFQDLGLKHQLRSVTNYDRALLTIIQKKADGFLLGTENNSRNKVAVLSEPLMMNRWSWFSMKAMSERPTKQDRIGTIRNTNTHKWLVKNGYQVRPVDNLKSLYFQLKKKRIDYVFVAEMVFKKSLKDQKVDSKSLGYLVERERPFGIYLSLIHI